MKQSEGKSERMEKKIIMIKGAMKTGSDGKVEKSDMKSLTKNTENGQKNRQ